MPEESPKATSRAVSDLSDGHDPGTRPLRPLREPPARTVDEGDAGRLATVEHGDAPLATAAAQRNVALAETADSPEQRPASSPAPRAPADALRGLDLRTLDSELRALAETVDHGSLSAESGDALCGQTMQHFYIRSLLGQGGMGRVYSAHDLSLDREVALKVIRVASSDGDQRVARFVREARAQARLSHPNIVPIYYVGVHELQYFFAMEKVVGRSLEDGLEQGDRLGWEQALELMIQVAGGLRHAHQAGFIHRDIKPGNLLLDSDGRVKIADFGLARPLDEAARAGGFAGTPLFASPEQCEGKPLDHRSDMYAVGATFANLLIGKPIFDGANALEIIAQHISAPAPPLRRLLPAVPERFAAIVDTLLAKRPDDRFASYEELIAALQDARPERRQPAGVWVRALARLIDVAMVGIVAAATGGWGWLAGWAYLCVAWATKGRSVGQWLVNLRVVGTATDRVRWSSALVRGLVLHWGVLAAVLIDRFTDLRSSNSGAVTATQTMSSSSEAGTGQVAVGGELNGIGILVVVLVILWIVGLLATIFMRDKRGLHDRAARTTVVFDLGTRPGG